MGRASLPWLALLAVCCMMARAEQRFGKVTIEAERHVFDAARNIVEASGGVKITSGGMTLVAERVTYNVNTGEAVAEGQVVISEPGREFRGASCRYNFQSGEGYVKNVFARDETLGVRLYLKGGEIEIRPASWILRDARISTTLEEEPNYLVTAREVELIPGDRWYARDVKLYVFGHKILSTSEYSRSVVHPEKFVLDLLPDFAYTPEESFYIEYDRETRIGGDIWARGLARLSPRSGLTGEASVEFRPRRGYFYAKASYRDDPRDPFLPWLRVTRLPEVGATYPLVAPRKSFDLVAHAAWGRYLEYPTGSYSSRTIWQLRGGHSELKIGKDTRWRYEFGASHAEYGRGRNYDWAYGGVFVRHRFGNDLHVSLGYLRYFVRGRTPFLWDDIDVPHELRTGIRFPLVGRFYGQFVGRYDVEQKRYRDTQYGLLYRDTDFVYSATWLQRRRELLLEIKLPLTDGWF